MSNYDVWDKNWLKKHEPSVHRELVSLIKHYSPGKKILEIGYGSGGDLSFLKGIGFESWGLEKSKVAYNLSIQHGNFNAVLGNGERTHFRDKEFDLIFHQGVLEHFKSPTKLVSEQSRILKENGVIVMDVPHKWNLFTLYKKVYQLFGRWYGGWERSYSASELKNLIEPLGFETIIITYRGIWPHRWGKFLFPKQILKRKWVGKIIKTFPVNVIQNSAKKIYDSCELVRLVSSHNIIIVARKK
jgi:ubiquinone/menaquinone biosynthesis C-methylase UbiE